MGEHDSRQPTPTQGIVTTSSETSEPEPPASTPTRTGDAFTSTGLAEFDLNGCMVWCDDSFCELIGSQREQLAARTIWDVFPLTDPAPLAVAWRQQVASAYPIHVPRLPITCQDGSRVWITVTLSLVGISSGAPQHVIALVQGSAPPDQHATTHLPAPDAEARAGQLAAILGAIADGVLVYDHKGRILQTNAADSELLRMALHPDNLPATLHERGLMLNVRDDQGRPLPEEQWVATRVLRGETLRSADAQDMTFRRRDGQDILVNVTGAPIRDASGQLDGGVVIIRDVTQRRHLERQTHDALSALLVMAEILVSGADTAEDTRLATARMSQRLADLTRTVLGCQRVTIVPIGSGGQVEETWGMAGPIPPEEQRQWQANWPAASQRQIRDFLPADIIARLKNDELVPADRSLPPYNRWPNPLEWRSMLLVPMLLGTQLVGILTLDYGPLVHEYNQDEFTLARGVTRLALVVLERERLLRAHAVERAQAMALAEANRRMDEFLGIATHELKTPVTSTSLSVSLAAAYARDLLARARPGDSELMRELEAIQGLTERAENSVERLSRLVSDLLDVSRIRAGKLEFRLDACDLAAIVRDAVEEQRQLAPGRIIHLSLAPSTAIGVTADADRIRQVITNYLNNALTYAPPDRPVRVGVRVRAGMVRVAVHDAGPGVPAADRARIWERFQRGEGQRAGGGPSEPSGTSVPGGGLGLGLHICKTIIERHSGQIGLRSAPGRGATFWFSLPLPHAAS